MVAVGVCAGAVPRLILRILLLFVLVLSASLAKHAGRDMNIDYVVSMISFTSSLSPMS